MGLGATDCGAATVVVLEGPTLSTDDRQPLLRGADRALAGILVLGVGTSYYLICRAHPPSVLEYFATFHQCHTGWLSTDWLGGFPTFSHTLGFALLCTGLTCNEWQSRWGFVWAGTNIGAELWSTTSSMGTFDPVDIVSACMAGLFALMPGRGGRLC